MARSIGALIDKLYALQQERLELERKHEAALKKIRVKEETTEAQLLKRFSNSALEGARGMTATSKVSETEVPTVTDWNKVYDYVRNKGSRAGPRFELLHKRMSTESWRELKDSGILVPGTQAFTRRKVKVYRIGARAEPKAVKKPRGRSTRRAG